MKNIKKATNATKNFVHDHKVAIAVTLTALTCLKLNRMALRDHDEFLKEKGLFDEFYGALDS